MTQLSELQIAELKKAFSICDLDGSGTIVASELRIVIRAITDSDPTDEEFKQIVATVDQNRDGNITWEEFYAAMTEWLAEDFNSTSEARRKLSAEEERAELHLKIKGFFSQFSPSQNFEEIRKKLQRYGSSSLLGSGSNHSMNTDGTMSSKEKLDFLMQYRNGMEGIGDAIKALFSPSRFDHHQGVSHFAKLLHIVEVFRTPQERRAAVDDIVPLFEKIVQNNVQKRLVQMCQLTDQPPLQLEALRAIALFAPGPRVASTPRDSLLHPSQMHFKKLLFQEGALPVIFKLCESPVIEVMNQAVVCMGVFAAHNPEVRDYMLQNGALQPLLKLVRNDAPVQLLINVSWTLAVLCGVTHPSHSLPNSSTIKPALAAIGTLLFANNEKVLRNVLVALALSLPGLSPQAPVTRRLVELLTVNVPSVVEMDLHTITDLVRFDTQHTTALLNSNLLLNLKKLLTHKSVEIRAHACDLIDALASVRGHVQPLIDSGIVEVLLKLISLDEDVRWKLVKVIKYISRGIPSQVKYMCDRGVVQILCKRFREFKSYDRVLNQVYKVGEMLREETSGQNPYAMQFDMGAMDNLLNLLQTIKSSKESDLNAWRPHVDNEASVESKIVSLIQKLKKAHSQENGGTSHIISMIQKIESEYLNQGNTETSSTSSNTNSQEQNILLKCYLESTEDVSVVDVPSTLTYTQLKEGIKNKYGRDLRVSFKDMEGDMIKIDSDSVLHASFLAHKKSKEPTMKIYLSEIPVQQATSPATASLTANPQSSSDGDQSKSGPASVPASAPIAIPAKNRGLKVVASSPPTSSTNPSPFGSPVSVRKVRHRDYFTGTPPRPNSLKRSREGDSIEGQPSTKRFNPFTPTPSLGASGGFSLTLDVEQIRQRQVHKLLTDLEQKTHFGLKELTTLHEWVTKNSSKSGVVDRKAFALGLREIGITDPLSVEQNFSAFDTDKSGTIDFREFVAGLSVVLHGSNDEKLKLMFNSFDIDGDGFLSRDEIHSIFKISVLARGAQVPDQELTPVIDSVLQEIDENNDGKISFEEFEKAVRSQKLPFNMNPLNPQQAPTS